MRMMMWNRLRRADEEQGVVLVIVVISIVAIFAMIVLTVDVGGLLLKRRALVNGSDAGALAAAESCALGANSTFPGTTTPVGTPESRADTFAVANVDGDLNNAATNIVPSETVNCTSSQPNPAPGPGHVTVAYQGQQQLFFAQVLGFGNTSTVGFKATAAWGPSGSGKPVPIVLNLGSGQGNCDIPNVAKGTICHIWEDNNVGDFGGSAFGLLNLDQWSAGPTNDPTISCNQAGGQSNVGGYISGDWPGSPLPLNYPSPTYVCVVSGNQNSGWDQKLSARKGDLLTFPINDPNNDVTNPGGGVDKFDIVGFGQLELVDVVDANNAGGSAGSCNLQPVNFPNASPMDVAGVGAFQGCLPSTWDPINNGDTITNIQLTGHQPNCCTLGTDYTVATNPLDGHPIVTWTSAQSHDDITVSYDWKIQGVCGPPPPNASGHCLVLKWDGASIGGGNPGGGQNFGFASIRLCDPSLNASCPAGS